MQNIEAEAKVERIQVAVAIVIEQDKVLISKRDRRVHMGGRWEFPGGKLERGESEISALRREIKEELAIEVDEIDHLVTIDWDYPGKNAIKKVRLLCYRVLSWRGDPHGAEFQEIRWVPINELEKYEFPDANSEIIRLLKCNGSDLLAQA